MVIKSLRGPALGRGLRAALPFGLALGVLLTALLAGGCGPAAPSPTPTQTPAPIPSPSPTPAPTTRRPPSPSPTPRPTRTPTPSPAVSPTPSPTPSQVRLDDGDADQYLLERGTIRHPHGLVLLRDTAYLVDAGQLVAISLPDGQARRLSPPDGLIEGLPVGEIIFPALAPDGKSLLLLDKRGDLYRYNPTADQWGVERPIDRRRSAPNPVPCAVASYNERAYLLDMTYSQVWRHPYDDVPEGYLPGGDAPTNRLGTAFDVSRGIDLGVDRDVYVLLREGHDEPAGLIRFTGAPAERDHGFAQDLSVEGPTRLYLDAETTDPLYLIDQEGHRLRVLDRESGAVLQTLTFRDETVEMRAVYAAAGQLYIAAPDVLYSYPGTGQVHTVTGGAGPVPEERPDEPQRLATLTFFTLPISGVRYIPERASLLPGSPRVYRYGIHHGLDFYGGTMGVDIPYGAPIYAAADGVVTRADHEYQELSPAEWDELSDLCGELHMTPPEIEDLFRGRQVWIDHGDGVETHYAHLSGIPEEIITGTVVTQGRTIGYVGNSGTSEGAAGTKGGAHLHFEIHLDGPYLGEGLSMVEVWRLLQRIFLP